MFSKRTDWKLDPNRFTQAHQELLATGREIIDLTVSNPTRAGFRYDAAAILHSLGDWRALDYDPQPRGLRSAREAVASYYTEQSGALEIDSESLVLTTSTSEGYSYILRLLCDVEDEILVPKPSYPLFEFLADLQDVKLVPYPLLYDHGWQIDFPSLERAVTLRTRAVVLVHPNNPTGSYVSAAERAELNAFCAERNLALIVDEVFLDYPLDGVSRHRFANNRDALTFTLSGLSKISGLPQMKLAWIAVSGPATAVNDAMGRLEIVADTFLSMNAPVQLASAVLLDQRKRLQPILLNRVRANLQFLDDQLRQQKTCRRLQVEGGWYVVMRVPVTRSDEELAIALLHEQSVLAHPGHFFDFPDDGYLVLSLITPEESFRQGIARVLETLNR